MNKEVIFNLDALLLLLATNYLGSYCPSTELLKEAGHHTITRQSLFLIDILIADNYVTVHNAPSATPIITISPRGYRFYHSGGYATYLQSNFDDVSKEQTKMKLEIRNLQWGFWISLISLILSIMALFVSALFG